MSDRENQMNQYAGQDEVKYTTSDLDDSQIEKQHQFQMFPTPDEEFAYEIITELED
ncbi:hypothetical protein [Brevibacillus invocatus]|uniref:hypothetical protein n=1 Tax=Brevibacillus invocatus TaxID=173959 RepID=UPI0016068D83|nr:hypothetical protein [Brevibacillus invocatus]